METLSKRQKEERQNTFPLFRKCSVFVSCSFSLWLGMERGRFFYLRERLLSPVTAFLRAFLNPTLTCKDFFFTFPSTSLLFFLTALISFFLCPSIFSLKALVMLDSFWIASNTAINSRSWDCKASVTDPPDPFLLGGGVISGFSAMAFLEFDVLVCNSWYAARRGAIVRLYSDVKKREYYSEYSQVFAFAVEFESETGLLML